MYHDYLEHDGSNAAQHRRYLIDVMLMEDGVPLSTVAAVMNMTPEEVAAKQAEIDEDAAEDSDGEEEEDEEADHEDET